MATKYDVLIIGSGASGGTVAYTLTKKGISCLMLDAGPVINYSRDRAFKKVYELPTADSENLGGSHTSPRRVSSTRTCRRTRNKILIRMILTTRTIGCVSGWWAARLCCGVGPAGE